MRLFTAVDLPDEVLAQLEALLVRLRPTAHIHWSPVGNLHITTKFIGELPEERLPELTGALGSVTAREAIAIRVRRLGFFPASGQPLPHGRGSVRSGRDAVRGRRTFWAGVESAALPLLAADTDRAAATLGIETETRPYSPHLTLARIKDGTSLASLHDAIAHLGDVDFGAFDARSFFLYRSQMQRGGSVYTKLAEFPLSRS